MKNLIKPVQFIIGFIVLVTVTFTTNAQSNQTPVASSKTLLEQTLLEHKGKVIYIDFWASWCVPCRKSFPWMNTIQDKYKQQGFTVVSINLDANKALAEKFLIEMPASFPVIYDPKGKLAKHFNIQGMPSSMLIGRDGTIKSRHTGFFTNKIKQYQQEIEQFLTEKEVK
ncbi:TlpA disulfide reductase family protein [Colwellia sp. 4_MG-2023]|uniref:TlpA family protein disulfide reductase n=1 Tax=unclassified Colwellia TaxID=196834 RepID=UPI002091CB5A|nr:MULTISPECIES: TlpA disulfide reductase family protein [unclassified Colwellia]MDO6508018.1 TlpA disulfide reductase family protein [Colwellia sp. 5_MG-2023]MDO6556801.1 TlpA disulfide reductase family protein [Colwellia sp. 4_MG-2023]MDO6653753.1 TlpA disulfide reductase family protein [Colwellia sp. 3_MG-2023]MDO6666617.1 TlpA disulfide reductase family protein [Colwellia sp. 2_MG-2023]MDO6691060.1 TlpA disulfide reductase family protein [Colwellia sp. 1_MG-2023]